MMSETIVAGLRPWLPWPLRGRRWWTEPVPAARLAALRIGLAAVVLGDLLTSYWPHCRDFFGRDSLGGPEIFSSWWQESMWRWSLLRGIEDPRLFQAVMVVWTGAALLLLIGYSTRLSALIVWILSTSFANLNSYIDNAGDLIRGILLLYLVLSPCGVVWSLDSWRQRRTERRLVRILPWPLRLLFLQMVLMYFSNGLYKLAGDTWRTGDSLYYVLNDLTLARWSYVQLPIPDGMLRGLTWIVLGWELSFPLCMCWRWTRIGALLFGVIFHVGIGLSLELGAFPLYALCLYLPLVPWEKWSQRG